MANEKKLKQKEITCQDVADYFLAFANETEDPITNLKLQKLVYYAQAWHLANYSKPLFDADFEAWVHGPVIPSLYFSYQKYGPSLIESDFKMEDVKKRFTPEAAKFLREVAKIYMPYGAYHLERMTHQEDPWNNARGHCEPDEKCESIIPKDSMKKYYGEKIKI
ncbi:DUF4065 domain-containing protein [Patescibacteria group bacterium]|nr:DUF4065 domain-containing protein [Patescibacteria group bacterium]MBU4512931.1 DUF4065 domain-containing protein [Patescibacteria group bacterium]